MLSSQILPELITIVRRIAEEELVPRFREVSRDFKRDGSVITEADLAMQNSLAQALGQKWPQFTLLGEEMSQEQQQALLDAPGEGLWIVDPLDGTRNFAAGVPCYSVSIALVIDKQIELGLVYDPAQTEAFSAQRGKGAWLNNKKLGNNIESTDLANCMAVVDFKRLQQTLASNIATKIPYASQRSFGSVALDWCWLAAGRVHVYLHGKQNLWDYAAGLLILEEAGGQSLDLLGQDVFNNSLQPRSAVAALDEDLFTQWWSWIQANQ